jgi:serine/threonine protein kinase
MKALEINKLTGNLTIIFIFNKKLYKIQKIEQDNIKYAISERSIIKKCNSPFIIKLYHSFETEKHLIMILDYCPGGDLYTFL